MGRGDYIWYDAIMRAGRAGRAKMESGTDRNDGSDRSDGSDGWSWVVVFKWSDYRVVRIHAALAVPLVLPCLPFTPFNPKVVIVAYAACS